MQNRATFTENMASVEQARLYQLNPNVDPPKFSLASTDAKDERSNSDNERAELERIVAALPNIVRAMAFPLPVCHEHPHICANTARIMGAENASAFPPTTVASQRANGDVEGIRGLSATGDIARQIGRYRPGISNTSSSQSGSTAFAEDGSNGPNSEGSPSTPSSCCDSDNKIQEDRKGAV
jgi:hypothetical protein